MKGIDFTIIGEIASLFEVNKWNVDIGNKNSLYNRVICLYKNYNDDERKLLLKLLQNYQMISIGEYEQNLIKLLEKACIKYNIKTREIYIMPIKQRNDVHKVKSADLVTYLCKGTAIRYSDILYRKKFISISNLDFLVAKLSKFERKKLFILDDFVGSGKYAVNFIKELEKVGLSKDKIVLLTSFIHKKGSTKMDDNNIEYEYGEIIDDGILSKLTIKEVEVLEKIEKDLKIDNDFKFGYDKSAALISLVRTPNNTLPMFWYGKYAPFPRVN